jgi:hypothetical protein
MYLAKTNQHYNPFLWGKARVLIEMTLKAKGLTKLKSFLKYDVKYYLNYQIAINFQIVCASYHMDDSSHFLIKGHPIKSL